MTAASTAAPALGDLRAIVTGGASGIGAAVVRRLLAGGAQVAVLDRDVSGSHPDAACGRSSTEKVSPARDGEVQVRPSRPRPACCSSATSTVPSGAPSAAAATRSELVLAVDATTRTVKPSSARFRANRAADRGGRSRSVQLIGAAPDVVRASPGTRT